MTSRRIESVVDRLLRVVNKLLFMKRKSVFRFEGVSFYPSEVHLMLVVREKSATNATRMAEELGVTKGAVSQTLSRLSRKGVLTKTKDTSRKNEITLTFTPLGARAYRHYLALAAGVRRMHKRHLMGFNEEEKQVIERFLVGLEDVLDELH